jgi:geranylgeranyl pyrophosphate synthase
VTRPSAVPPPVTAVLDASSRWLPARLGEVETLLREQSAGHGEPLAGDAGATLAAGGKRLRPLLVLLCAGPDGEAAAVRAAAAIELVHMATLVHDDVLDDAPLRRGRPTVAATSGRDRAVATGDLLFSRAFALLAKAADERAVSLLAEASTALARGELAQRHDAFDTSISEQRYLERCRLKTAALFRCGCLLGLNATRHPRTRERGREASGDDERVLAGAEEMAEFGSSVGLAFQLLDDVLDVRGPPERTGKARGTDLLDGTVTLPLIEALKADPNLLRCSLTPHKGVKEQRELDLRSLDTSSVEDLCDRIAATGALDKVRSRALDMVVAAKKQLDSPAFDPEQKQLLELVADGVVQRYS